ncbi:MAG: glycosyltransferase [Cocleimonas sp.]|nr:glycosyltransferase [Cocleimonas sp.]
MQTDSTKADNLSVCIMPERHTNDEPSASAFVRLLLPYANNLSLTKNWNITVSKKKKLPDPSVANIFIIERDVGGVDFDRIANWLIKLREGGKKCIYELDDDFFNVEGLYKRTGRIKANVKRMVDRTVWIASAADAVVVSTPQLYKLASKYNDNVFLLPNYLDPQLWDISSSQLSYDKKKSSIVKIGYVGTPTHNEDLMVIADVMDRIKREYGDQIEVEVIGAFQKDLNNPIFGKAIPLPKARAYPKFVKWLREQVDWDIAVIPLVDDIFNESKSHLKFLESTALGLVSICSDVPTYSSIVKNNKNGLLVNNNFEEWYQAIKLLIDHREKREELARSAYLDLFEKYTTHTNSDLYHQVLVDVSALTTSPKIPPIKRSVKEYLIRYVAKSGSRNSRLCVKLLNDPHHYFLDSKHVFLRPIRVFFRKR